MVSQSLLFSEPTFSETGVWCEISPGIDPAQWAFICRFIGKLSPREFDEIVSKVKAQQRAKEVKVDQLFEFREVPLISIGCSGIGGEYTYPMHIKLNLATQPFFGSKRFSFFIYSPAKENLCLQRYVNESQKTDELFFDELQQASKGFFRLNLAGF